MSNAWSVWKRKRMFRNGRGIEQSSKCFTSSLASCHVVPVHLRSTFRYLRWRERREEPRRGRGTSRSVFRGQTFYRVFIGHTFSIYGSPYRSVKEENTHTLTRGVIGSRLLWSTPHPSTHPCSPSCRCGELWGQPLGGAFFYFFYFIGHSCWNKWKSVFFFVLFF